MGFLFEIAHARAVQRLGFTVEFLIDSRHDLEQGGLTRTIDPDHADLGVGIEAQPDIFKNLLAARIDLGQALHLEDILLRHGFGHLFLGL